MKIINILFICIITMIISCQSNTNEYIEITTGIPMNPNQPRIGIIVNGNDSVYMCKEIINGGGFSKLTSYKYYAGKEKINFNKYKKEVKLLFGDTIIFNFPQDGEMEKLKFFIDNKNHERFFTTSILNDKQNKIFYSMKELMKKNNFVEIPYHKFSRDLLDSKIPDPPPLPK
ncbi:hypothetical protein [Chryseobacterium sp.]|uniref:hypothetical protein n=1 Tax=Chryseobacterium sp. TaxID=1871047 RepID=UPI00388E1337